MIHKLLKAEFARTIVCFCILAACSNTVPEELILFDFETDSELDRIHWKCFTLFGLSDMNATHGVSSLAMELYPSSYPGWNAKLSVKNWQRYKTLGFDVYNPESREVHIGLRIDDREDYPDYADRYNQQFLLKPGMNRLKIPLKSLVTSGTGGALDLKNIYRFLIFMGYPERKYLLYLDYIRLIS